MKQPKIVEHSNAEWLLQETRRGARLGLQVDGQRFWLPYAFKNLDQIHRCLGILTRVTINPLVAKTEPKE